ncbi:ligase-associated DNA damage response endonuclease PdeM [Aestuariivirga litoralis]|uniref:Ligase-associated DNA damage response endonuclease PdeM n=1 Tax=Aestuariivirga litoralis TaxID=2650924 RepID=A0A2W2BEJ4_9HYPH|nr:ligase-associated DNA damage response endonuclease PdeM [Aestuariivirga litoralis]
MPSSTRPCGLSRSHRITLSGVDFIPDLSGALFAPEFNALLVADLHLEKGTSLARRGVHLPPYDTRESLLQLKAAVESTRPQRLIFLGDSFHDQGARERIDASDLAMLRAITAKVETVWITGNHDPAPPEDVGGMIVEEMVLGPVSLRHHQKALRDGEAEISGHLHPAAAIHARGHRIRCRCFIADEKRLIMPAFGSYTGALSVRSEAFEGLFGDFHVWMIGDKAVHRFPAAQVR